MSDILKHTIDLFELDSIQYAQGFEYYNSVYKVVDFFELGNLDLFSIVQHLKFYRIYFSDCR